MSEDVGATGGLTIICRSGSNSHTKGETGVGGGGKFGGVLPISVEV